MRTTLPGIDAPSPVRVTQRRRHTRARDEKRKTISGPPPTTEARELLSTHRVIARDDHDRHRGVLSNLETGAPQQVTIAAAEPTRSNH